MSPDTSRWLSPEAYAYLDALSPAEVAWEYLRRNTDYQDDYRKAFIDGRADLDWSARWGLRFPRRPRTACSASRGTLAS